tara:strand:+ start:1901 stop:3127 length:1227 start_codon:yes stop_codon:yes gene_type:complete
MADTNTTNQGLLLMEEGSHSNEWGDLTNLNLRRIDAGLRGYQLINLSAPLTLDATDITTTSSTPESNSHYRFLEFTGTSSTVTVADVNVVWMIYNHTGGAMTFQPTTGTGLSLPDNKITAIVRGPDGNNFVNASSLLAVPALTGGVTTSGDVATVVTNANLTGKITSVGNATTVNPAQTDITSLGTLTGLTVTGDVAMAGLTVTGDVAMAEKADHTVGTPAAGYGYLWTKNTVPTQLYFTNDAGDDINLSEGVGIESAVSGHVRAGNTQLVTGTTTLANYNVSNSIAENTWVTVGPTGSGATQIWAALDVLPTTATILLASVFISVTTNSSAQPGQMRFNAASGDVVSPNTHNTQIAAIGFDPASTISLTEQGMIPLGAGRIFKAYWLDIANVVPSDVSLGYRGFMTD